MTADENAAIMQRAYDAFNTGDIETLTEIFDERCVWHLLNASYARRMIATFSSAPMFPPVAALIARGNLTGKGRQ